MADEKEKGGDFNSDFSSDFAGGGTKPEDGVTERKTATDLKVPEPKIDSSQRRETVDGDKKA